MALTELKAQIDKLRQFSFRETLVSIVEQNSEVIADLQAKQLAEGKKSDGAEINPPYRPYTIEQKKKYGVGLGRVTDHVTYYQTGELYRSLEARVQGEEYDITSSSFKFDKMKKRSGERVVGLNRQSKQIFAEEIVLPNTKRELKEKTGLSF